MWCGALKGSLRGVLPGVTLWQSTPVDALPVGEMVIKSLWGCLTVEKHSGVPYRLHRVAYMRSCGVLFLHATPPPLTGRICAFRQPLNGAVRCHDEMNWSSQSATHWWVDWCWFRRDQCLREESVDVISVSRGDVHRGRHHRAPGGCA